MADITKFPQKPEAPISITLTGAEWFALALKLAGRPGGEAALQAEAKLIAQLNKATRK